MRVASFLPSATEMLFALGLEADVVAVTFECDYPPQARSKPQVVHSHMPPGLTPAEIDAIVRAEGAQGRSLYFADIELLERLAPELILLQDLCRVCAIDSPTLARDMSRLPSQPTVFSLSAQTLQGVLGEIRTVAELTGRTAEADRLLGDLQGRISRVEHLHPLRPQPTVLALEWLDPFFQGGHWIPEMITLAGGVPVLARPGEKSVRLTWKQVRNADPDIIVVMPCGYHLQETIAQYREATFPEGWNQLRAVESGNIFAVDGSAFFSRPGPRLVDGLEILARLFRQQPGDYVALGPAEGRRCSVS